MTDEGSPQMMPNEGENTSQPWDAAEVMRRRADTARAKRDDLIKQIREALSDDDVLAEFGIDLGEIEK